MKPSNYDRLKLKVDDVAVIQGRNKLLCYCYTQSLQQHEEIEPTHFLREVTREELYEELNDCYTQEHFDTLFFAADMELYDHIDSLLNRQENRTETVPVYEVPFDVVAEIDRMIREYDQLKETQTIKERIISSCRQFGMAEIQNAIINLRNAQHAKDINNLLNKEK